MHTSMVTSVSTITIGVTTHPVKCMSSGSESYCFALVLCVFSLLSKSILTLLFVSVISALLTQERALHNMLINPE